MSPTDGDRSRRLFDAALALPSERRAQYLRENCSDDEALRLEVEELLALADTPDGPLDRTPGGALAQFSDHLSRGDKLGRYTIDSVIGQGGMGIVYRAKQEEPERDVAVKVVHEGIFLRSAVRRFAQEAAVLGRLKHPGIAAVIEASLTGGRPFIAMELVEGESIISFASAHSLNLRGKLELVAKVCDALHHAHVKGVIHRDIKPANLLVDLSGQPRVLDFGIARLTEGDTAAGPMTGAGQLVGTLAYMSPEQTGGDPTRVDARCDVYALGVVLYELLCGRPPLKINDAMVADAVMRIQSEAPTPPRDIVPGLPDDVDTIVRRALEKEPHNRYQHASDLAADIRRYLADEPIMARPHSTWYQVSKFARRNRILVGAVSSVVACIIIALGLVTVAMFRARDAEKDAATKAQLAREEAARATRFGNFLRNILAVERDSVAGKDTTVLHMMLERAEKRLPALDDDPQTRAAILAVIGNSYRDFGRPGDAVRVLAEAVRVSTQTKGPESIDTLFARDALAAAKISMSDYVGAADDLREIAEIRERVDPEKDRLATTLSNYALALEAMSRTDEAIEAIERTEKILTELNDTDARLGLAIRRGRMLSEAGRVEEADAALRSTLALVVERHGWSHVTTIAAYIDWCRHLKSSGRFEEAYTELIRCKQLAAEVHGRETAVMLGILDRLSGVCVELARWDEAEAIMMEMKGLVAKTLGDDSLSYWALHGNIASLYRLQGKADLAEPYSRAALDGIKRNAPQGCVFTGGVLLGHAETLRLLGRREDEAPLLVDAWDFFSNSDFADPEQAKYAAGLAASAFESINDAVNAALWSDRAEPVETSSPPPQDP